MAGRSLGPEERRLWGAVMATVRPLRGGSGGAPRATPIPATPAPAMRVPVPPPPAPARPVARPRPAADTLDGGWDRRLGRGAVAPDAAIDLHGHSLASAHAVLDAGLARSVARGDRVLLLVTGKPPRPDSERPHARGAIRAAVADWLGASRHADSIAAVRGAHPRHGGAGALYIVLRRARQPA